ncbi:MAG: ankyrin repeat domain-containing protein, partial [Planctomycetota bacterium]|nr:ankyrin repeat domain-containing protein [Planctomycetota bacterium]
MGLLNVVKLLVEKGAEVNGMANEGGTPLHTAVYFGQKAVVYFLLERGAVAVIANNEGLTPLDVALKPEWGTPNVALICKMLLPSGALVHLAKSVVEAPEKRQKRIVKGLKRAVRSPGFLEDLADTLAGIHASGCARGTGAMLVALYRQLDAFAKAADEGPDAGAAVQAPRRRGLGDAYEDRRGRHRLAVAAAVRSADFLSGLAEGLAGVNMNVSDPVPKKQLVAAALKMDALAAKRIGRALVPAVRSPGFLEDLAD